MSLPHHFHLYHIPFLSGFCVTRYCSAGGKGSLTLDLDIIEKSRAMSAFFPWVDQFAFHSAVGQSTCVSPGPCSTASLCCSREWFPSSGCLGPSSFSSRSLWSHWKLSCAWTEPLFWYNMMFSKALIAFRSPHNTDGA